MGSEGRLRIVEELRRMDKQRKVRSREEVVGERRRLPNGIPVCAN